MSASNRRHRTWRARLRAPAVTVLLALAAARLPAAADGAFDPTFNGSGWATVHVDAADVAYAVAAQPDGKVLAAGRSEPAGQPTNVAFLVARRNADGTVDTSFGPLHDGQVTIDFDLGPSGEQHDEATSIAVQTDGKIVVAGYAQVDEFGRRIAVARLTPAGTLDSTFGNGTGKVAFPIPDAASFLGASAVLLRRDGNILVTPTIFGGDSALLQLVDDGSPDASFGTNGWSDICGTDACGNLGATLEMPDGNLLAVGRNVKAVAVVRYAGGGSGAGTVDPTFGTGGVAFFPPPGVEPDGYEVVDAALDTLGRPLVLVGQSPEHWNVELLRLRGDQTDPTFGAGGWAAFTFRPSDDLFTHPTALAVQSDGKLIVAGVAAAGGNYDGLLTRLKPDGSDIDTTFSGGWRLLSFDFGGELADSVNALAASGGRILVGGFASDDSGGRLLVARLDNALVWSDGFESGSTWFWGSSSP